jgi:hypothetical protein
MGIEKLRMAASAAGFAMADSEELPTAAPHSKRDEFSARQLADPAAPAERPGGTTAAAIPARHGGLRAWWLTLTGKA